MPDKIQPMPALNAPSRKGNPLAVPLKHSMEAESGVDLSDVRYHVGHEATMLGALAFTHGSDIYLAPGAESRLRHEAWHIVQQRKGVDAQTQPVAEGLVVVGEQQQVESTESS